MKLLQIWGILLFSCIVLFPSCEDERLTPYDDYTDGSLPVLGNPEPSFLNLLSLDDAKSTFSMDIRGNLEVDRVNLFVAHNNGGNPVPYKSISSFPSDVEVTAQEMMGVLGLSNADISYGDVFTITMDMDTPSGKLSPNTSLSIFVDCVPIITAGDYTVTTVYSFHDCIEQSFMEHTMDVTLSEVSPGVYSIPDFTGGLYSVGCYVNFYDSSAIPAEITELCGNISWSNVLDDYLGQEFIATEGATNSVDANGVITISATGDKFGESWVSTYTPK